jgi:hypothetical protein
MSNQPAAFMSYVRSDDEHDKGRITQFSEQLSAEVRAQSGAEFSIFVDRNDIGWGQNWQARIDESLETATLLVVIMTPALFRSRAARTEIESFLARERDLGRYDLILPVYYISTPELEDPHQREGDELARVLASRQFADWRHLRFEEFDSPTGAQCADRPGDKDKHDHPAIAVHAIVSPRRVPTGSDPASRVRYHTDRPRDFGSPNGSRITSRSAEHPGFLERLGPRSSRSRARVCRATQRRPNQRRHDDPLPWFARSSDRDESARGDERVHGNPCRQPVGSAG